jgi:hypothetical protein
MGVLKVRIEYEYREQALSIFTNRTQPDIAIIGGVAIENLIFNKKNTKIKTIIGDSGGRIAFYFKKYKLTPTVFTFLGDDVYLNMILKTFDKNGIPLTWGVNKNGNNHIIRIIDEKRKFFEINKVHEEINPILLEEALCNINHIFIKYEEWNSKIIDFNYIKGRKIFTDIDEFYDYENASFTTNYLFIRNLDRKNLQNITCDYYISFYEDKIIQNGLEIKIKDHENNLFFDEAISAYENVFIYYIMTKRTIEKANELALEAFNKTYKDGKI